MEKVKLLYGINKRFHYHSTLHFSFFQPMILIIILLLSLNSFFIQIIFVFCCFSSTCFSYKRSLLPFWHLFKLVILHTIFVTILPPNDLCYHSTVFFKYASHVKNLLYHSSIFSNVFFIQKIFAIIPLSF